MRERTTHQPPGVSANGGTYAKAFVRNAHILLGMGYAKLTPGEFAHSEEEDITGELVRAIDEVLDDTAAPPWADWFSVHEEPRVHDPVRKGKRRRRLDIRIDGGPGRPRPRLRFESKRLGPNHRASAYLGRDGLGCFLDGRYARDDTAAGMLGYIQEGDAKEWGREIGEAMSSDPKKIGLLDSSPWRNERLTKELSFSYRSGHARSNVGAPIEIFHTLLPFN